MESWFLARCWFNCQMTNSTKNLSWWLKFNEWFYMRSEWYLNSWPFISLTLIPCRSLTSENDFTSTLNSWSLRFSLLDFYICRPFNIIAIIQVLKYETQSFAGSSSILYFWVMWQLTTYLLPPSLKNISYSRVVNYRHVYYTQYMTSYYRRPQNIKRHNILEF